MKLLDINEILLLRDVCIFEVNRIEVIYVKSYILLKVELSNIVSR